MRNWADHCSSDEESLTEEVEAELASPQLNDGVQQEEQIAADPEPEHVEPELAESKVQEGPPPPVEKKYDFPSQPPFTAFIGNLAYSLDDGDKLKDALADLIDNRLGPGKINVLNGRIATDRSNGRHRGFGYVEVETVDQLKLLMEINDGQSQLAGRNIQLDTASARRDNNIRRNNNRNDKGSFGGSFNVDGAKFRGGRFGGKGGHDDNDAPPAQRTTLKLAPRSKTRGEGEGRGSSSGVFGGAKARDEGAWEHKKLEGGDRRPHKGRGGGRGGRGRNDGAHGGRNDAGRGGRNDAGRGGNKNKKNNNRRDGKPQESEPKGEKPKPAVKAPATKPEPAKSVPPAKKAAPVNKFALLMDSDSD
ncbi:unnamed protein product [Cylindrotheca closterium]|uniref:RRM domain-containing protein n=1 Tax=Cylindrotheca closterium TaxID=2856 RepID=A0AAD2FI07_9STRA|nr:unnamed protein product [Cylindrotheca closterium]